MNYIYDITLNLNKNKIYDFYEWKDEDNPEFILKIPVYKVDSDTFLNLKNNDIIVNKNFLNMIEDKTETYSPNSINIIRYCALFVSDAGVVAIEFDSDGNNYMKSIVSIDEENEIIDAVKNIKYVILEYKIKRKIKNNIKFSTRNEKSIESYMLSKIDEMKQNCEYSKLKYIFYELYNEKSEDVERIYSKLINVSKNDNSKFNKLNDILNLIENRKIMSNNS